MILTSSLSRSPETNISLGNSDGDIATARRQFVCFCQTDAVTVKPTCDGQLVELMNVKLATIERLALHKDHLKHSALINNPHLLRDLCPRESPIGSSLCRTPTQWQTRTSRASPKTPAWSSSSFTAQPLYNISHISSPLTCSL